MKLWQKVSSNNLENQVATNFDATYRIEKFTVGQDREMDMYLAEFDVICSMAHAVMLESIGLLEPNELAGILKECLKIYYNL